jgi:hypothetical protein
MLLKGGDKMKEARELLIETMRKHNDGKKPNNAAEVMHKLGHSVAMNQFAESRAIDAMGDAERAKMLTEAQERIRDL